jgi:membrane protease YdiL (CAAX protease family)
MLSAKPWRLEAVIRLGLGLFVCIYAGQLAATMLHFLFSGGKGNPILFYALSGSAFLCLAGTFLMARKPWQFEQGTRRLIVLLLLLYFGMMAGGFAQRIAGTSRFSVIQMIIAALSFQGAGLALSAIFLREHQVSWTEAFGLRNSWRNALVVGLMAACLFLPIGWGLQKLTSFVMTHSPLFQLKPEEQQAVQTLRSAGALVDRFALGIVTILLAPLAEEILFRGILYPAIKQFGFPGIALWGTSLLFAFVHLNILTFIPLLVLAMVLVALYEHTDNLLAPVAAHSLFNALNFTMLYAFESQLR